MIALVLNGIIFTGNQPGVTSCKLTQYDKKLQVIVILNSYSRFNTSEIHSEHFTRLKQILK